MLRKPQQPLVWSASGQQISRRDILVEDLVPLSPNFQITQFSSQFKLRIKAHNVRSILRLLKLRINFRKVGLDGLRLEDHKTWVCWFLFSVLRIIFGEYYIWQKLVFENVVVNLNQSAHFWVHLFFFIYTNAWHLAMQEIQLKPLSPKTLTKITKFDTLTVFLL